MPRRNKEADVLDSQIGIRIATGRKSRGMSRKQLADKLELTHQQISKIEKGQNRLSGGRIIQISRILKINLNELLNDEQIEVPADSQHQRMAIEISRNFMKITSVSNQYAVNQMVKILAENN